MVLSATVLPPVLGPEITIPRRSGGILTSIGTTVRPLAISSGWRAAFKRQAGVNDLRLDALTALREHGPRVERVKRHQRVEGHPQLRQVAAHHRGELAQDAPLLGLDLALEHHQAVVQVHRPQRLDEQRLAGDRAVLHDAFEPFGVVGLHRQHETAVADRNQVVGQEGLHPGLVERAGQPAFQFGALVAQPRAQALELAAGVIEQTAVIGQRLEQRVGHLLGREQRAHQFGDRGKALAARAQERLQMARGEHELAHVEQRLAVQRRPFHRGDREQRSLVLEFADRQRAGMRAQFHQLAGGAQAAADFVRIG